MYKALKSFYLRGYVVEAGDIIEEPLTEIEKIALRGRIAEYNPPKPKPTRRPTRKKATTTVSKVSTPEGEE